MLSAASTALDVEYVEMQSVATDPRVLLRTAALMLSGAGVDGHPPDDPLAAPRDQR